MLLAVFRRQLQAPSHEGLTVARIGVVAGLRHALDDLGPGGAIAHVVADVVAPDGVGHHHLPARVGDHHAGREAVERIAEQTFGLAYCMLGRHLIAAGRADSAHARFLLSPPRFVQPRIDQERGHCGQVAQRGKRVIVECARRVIHGADHANRLSVDHDAGCCCKAIANHQVLGSQQGAHQCAGERGQLVRCQTHLGLEPQACFIVQ